MLSSLYCLQGNYDRNMYIISDLSAYCQITDFSGIDHCIQCLLYSVVSTYTYIHKNSCQFSLVSSTFVNCMLNSLETVKNGRSQVK